MLKVIYVRKNMNCKNLLQCFSSNGYNATFTIVFVISIDKTTEQKVYLQYQ